MKTPNKNKPLVRQAYAKINLFLHVGPRRKDGYHDLQTIFQEISLHDTLTFTLAPRDISIDVHPPLLPTGSDNLAVRALMMLKKRMNVSRGMHVKLVKRIPMGAGLGGGSADAAAALWAGWQLWGNKEAPLTPSSIPSVLSSCASKLGADVSFFLRGGLAWAQGIGDQLTPLPPLESSWYVLVYPRVHVSTPLAYGLIDQSRKKNNVIDYSVRNSFEPPVFKKFPVLAQVKKKMLAAGCDDVFMSGSGSTMVGTIPSKAAGAKIVRALSRQPWDVFLVSTQK